MKNLKILRGGVGCLFGLFCIILLRAICYDIAEYFFKLHTSPILDYLFNILFVMVSENIWKSIFIYNFSKETYEKYFEHMLQQIITLNRLIILKFFYDDKVSYNNYLLDQHNRTPNEECTICMNNKSNVILEPCKHKSFCSECICRNDIKICPICRADIDIIHVIRYM